MKNKMKGQVTLIAVIVLLVTIMVIGALAPLYNVGIGLIVNNTQDDPTSQLLARFIFPTLLISVIISILGYSAFARMRQEGYADFPQ